MIFQRKFLGWVHLLLKKKESEVKKLYSYLKDLDETLKSKELKITELVNDEVEKQLKVRSLQEKKVLREELN